jgi:hypothetical protein
VTAGLVGSLSAQGQISGGSYTVDSQVLDGGGGTASAANYQVAASSVGGFIGTQSSANYDSEPGFVPTLLSPLLDLCDFESWIGQFFSPNDPDGARDVDHDGDGVDNEDEFLALTDPTDSSSRFTLRIEPDGTGRHDIHFAPLADPALRSYVLVENDDLFGPFFRLGVTPEIGADAESGVFEGLFSPATQRFFRIVIEKP